MSSSLAPTTLGLALPLVLFALPAAAAETGFLDRAVTVGRELYRYQVYVPPEWSPKRQWPVILYLHGSGESGDDGRLPASIALGAAIRRGVVHPPAVVVFPQCRGDGWWTDEPQMAQAMKALERSVREFHGDPHRLYLTGISMGGAGTWALAAQHPGKFAALVPICGEVEDSPREPAPGRPLNPYAETAKRIGRAPVWIFHGGADDVVPTEASRRMNTALRAAGGRVRYTKYPGVGHVSWDLAYAEPELWTWLFAQRTR
jgi:predicted peptidase